MFNKENFQDFPTVDIEPMPRIDSQLQNYINALVRLATYYQHQGNNEKFNETIQYIRENMSTEKINFGG